MRIFKVCAAKTKYNYYTINSDIESADVIFDGEQIGVIENGKFVCKIEEKTDTGSHTVKVENGTFVNKDTIYYLSAKITLTIPAAGVQYQYTVNYNVPNSTVLADGENVGTISWGSCVFIKDEANTKDSYNIYLSGRNIPDDRVDYNTKNS